LKDVRLSDNPVADPAKGGAPRFVLVARLGKVGILNGSEVYANSLDIFLNVQYLVRYMTSLILLAMSR
jgi:hypothetical protein